jgi:hypothetical protein
MTPSELQKLSEAYAAVYDADLRESFTTMKQLEKLVHQFIPFVKKELKLKEIPHLYFQDNTKNPFKIKNIPGITMIDDPTFSVKTHTFGRTSAHNRIVVDVANRQPLDALRTLAHELVHYYQHLTGVHGTGETGSPTENEANVKAAIIMRNFGDAHPEYFKLHPIE